MKILIALAASFIVGCAAVTLTEEEAATCKGDSPCLTEALEQKVYQKEYEAKNRRILEREQLTTYIQNCSNRNMTIIENYRGGRIRRPLIDRDGIIHLPRHAHISDYYCATSGQLVESFRRAGLL